MAKRLGLVMVDREEVERLLGIARALARYMFVGDVDPPPRDVIDAMGAPELRALAKRNSDHPLARGVIAALAAGGA